MKNDIEKDWAAKRDIIASSQGRFASITFTKKDGTVRKIRVQPAKLKFHLKGEDASDAGRRAAETRKANHPNLLPVWDIEAFAARSVNLETISRIAANGTVHTFS